MAAPRGEKGGCARTCGGGQCEPITQSARYDPDPAGTQLIDTPVRQAGGTAPSRCSGSSGSTSHAPRTGSVAVGSVRAAGGAGGGLVGVAGVVGAAVWGGRVRGRSAGVRWPMVTG